jgi:ribonuclease HII
VIALGIDENGLGPRLGPLLVTAVAAKTEGGGARRVETRARGAMARRLGDSKELVAYGNTALGEAWGRAIAARLGLAAETPDALLHALALDPRESLRRPCPTAHADQCWSVAGEAFESDDALVGEVAADLEKLARVGVAIAGVRVGIVCAARLNEALARGTSRFHVDLHTMERLALAMRESFGEELAVTCGKVGGIDRYAPHFGPLAGRLHTAIDEGRARSEYAFPGLFRIAFVRDADASHMLVAMASLVGKWARDLLMARVVRYHREHDPELPLASGYHDPVTARFVDGSALARKKRALPDDCFERRSLATASSPNRSAQAPAPRSRS